MKLFSTALSLLLALTLSSFAVANEVDISDSQVTISAQSCDELRTSGLTSDQLTKRGCCSWHDGVCGCSGGRQQCCDGSLSPSCTCNKQDPIDDIATS